MRIEKRITTTTTTITILFQNISSFIIGNNFLERV
jgi:hypothetical protein